MMKLLDLFIACSIATLTVVLHGCGGSESCSIANCKTMNSPTEPCTCTECAVGSFVLSADKKTCGDCSRTIANCEKVDIPQGATTCSDVTCTRCKGGPNIPPSADKKLCADCAKSIANCKEAHIPAGATSCSDPKVTCKQCEPNAFYDAGNRTCIPCSDVIANCATLDFHGATSCTAARITCGQCSDGALLTGGNKKCDRCLLNETSLQNCSAIGQIPTGVTQCKDPKVLCAKCSTGFERDLTDMTQCWQQPTCTQAEQDAGCAPFSCSSTAKVRIMARIMDRVVFMERALRQQAAAVNGDAASGCTCVPGMEQDGGSCKAMGASANMKFYMYRAVTDNHYNHGLDNTDAANLAGTLYYVAKNVVRGMSCPRHNDITKIVRYEVEVKNTAQNFEFRNTQFGHFVYFTKGVLADPQALELFNKYGYTAGCQAVVQANYSDSIWYSLPGACPNSTNKDSNCTLEYPGGMCGSCNGSEVTPVGNSTCTWNARFMGEITLDAISGIQNHADFCNKQYKEYDPETDKGSGAVTFWDDIDNKSRNLDRVRKVLRRFKERYPNTTQYPDYPDPICDGW